MMTFGRNKGLRPKVLFFLSVMIIKNNNLKVIITAMGNLLDGYLPKKKGQ
jgi:hypothetical protein